MPSRRPLKLLEVGKPDQAAQALTHRAQRRQPAAGDHGQGAALSWHRLPAAEEARAGHRRSDERAVAEGWTGRERSRRRPAAARRPPIRRRGWPKAASRSRPRRAERRARDADGLRVGAELGTRREPRAGGPEPVERRWNPFAGWFGGSSSPLPSARTAAGAVDHRIDRGSPTRRRRRTGARPRNPADGRATPRCTARPPRRQPAPAAERRPRQARRPVPHSGRDGAHAGRGAGACRPR